jgi:hypothetical protein
MKGADHSCHVKQWAALDSAFAQRARRLALEVGYYEVIAGMKHLSEVIVAMAPNPHDPDLSLGDTTKAALDLGFKIKNLFRILLNILRQLIKAP